MAIVVTDALTETRSRPVEATSSTLCGDRRILALLVEKVCSACPSHNMLGIIPFFLELVRLVHGVLYLLSMHPSFYFHLPVILKGLAFLQAFSQFS